MSRIRTKSDLAKTVAKTVARQPVYDVHTHLYNAQFGGLLLWGVDELVTYHYLVAEVMRYSGIPAKRFLALSKAKQADLIWQTLFLDNSPVSEACRGVLTTFDRLGVNLKPRDLGEARRRLKGRTVARHIDTVFELANVEAVVMTNDPFDAVEKAVWDKGVRADPRFKAALRIDTLLVNWPAACKAMKEWGYPVTPELTDNDCGEVRRFLNDWIDRMNPVYFAASLPPTFAFPDASSCGQIVERCLLEVGRERALPFAMMIGVKKRLNPELETAGDGVGKSDIGAVEQLCARFPKNKFLVTMLARENQHELCVAARKFRNLMVFGCWWFLNNPSLIREITRMRLELLGTSFIPQHSDARILDQLIYKWAHSREIIARALTEQYANLLNNGWPVTADDVRRDVENLLGANFKRFIGA